MEVPPHIQEKIKQLQQLQQHLQVVATQKYHLEMNVKEIEKTLEELNKISDDTRIFVSIGRLLVEVKDSESLRKKLIEEKETLEIRLKTLEKQIRHLEEKFNILQQEINQMIKGGS